MQPPTLPAAEPWLFERVGWDWRWLSWGEAAERVRALGEGLGSRPRAVGEFDWRPSVASVTAFLALARAGGADTVFTSSAEREGPAWSWPDGVEGVAPAFHDRGTQGDPAWLVEALAGSELGHRAERLAARLGTGVERDICVLGTRLDDPLGRLLTAWSVAVGAALVLEGQENAALPTAFWARPTVLALSSLELETLVSDFPRLFKGRRSPLGRLRAVLVDEPEVGVVETLRARGVAVVSGLD